MKHSWKITIVLLSMFFLTQIIALGVVGFYHPQTEQVTLENNSVVNWTSYNLPYGMDPPQDNNPWTNIQAMIIALVLAVSVMLLLMKFGVISFLRGWFFLVVGLAIGITLNALLIWSGVEMNISSWIALLVGLILGALKVYRRNIISHNITELMIYPGIAAIFVPLLSVWTVVALLVIISIYDVYAVWHAGFMQKMAKYQMQKLRVFSGFFIPYLGKKERARIAKLEKQGKGKNLKMKVNVAILGGGDVVFPSILAGVVLHSWGILPALIIVLGSTIALGLLFYYSEKGKFYPAMPFISAGCFVALVIAWLINL